ncbi:UMF1 family MFS transporter [Natronospira proteinivora]|uniref:UMF1 family MFS transporter n=1 Tax=Natronospira proteinivora TaxID=1807133 RepID=A0ABT1G9N6_9GAMM|nr:MFS transporter [Natronospira proteinivora]MCP1727966.1 UMF1 family MFS transporter [Natronospira proteinivora]
MVSKRRAPAREIFGWAMFDFANQAYTLLIITVIFGDLFTRVIVGDGPDYRLGNLLWSLALAVSYFLVVVSGPVCGAIMDYSRSRKRFLFASYVLTITATALLYFVEPGWIVLAMVLIIVSNFAYAIGENFIASFLPDLGPRKDLGWISGLGWGLGYIGGLIATAFTLVVLGEVAADNFDRLRWVGPFAAGFFLLAAIPTFLWLRERGRRRTVPVGSSYVRAGFQRLRDTYQQLRQFRDLSILLISIFFTMAGIYIIISFSFIYGAQVIQWDESVRMMMFVTVQITAAVGALGFGFLQSRIGARLTYLITLALWMGAIIAIWQTPNVAALAQSLWSLEWEAQYVFLFAGVLAGLSLGAAQSAGRALVGVLTPRGKAAEFFGFWGFASKLAAIFGILGLGLIQAWLGLADAILFCLSLFILAFIFALPVNEQRGEQVAENWRERGEG